MAYPDAARKLSGSENYRAVRTFCDIGGPQNKGRCAHRRILIEFPVFSEMAVILVCSAICVNIPER
jgi:hypothetical protein